MSLESTGIHCARHQICPGNSDERVKSYVRERGGEVGEGEGCRGVIQAFGILARKRGWEW